MDASTKAYALAKELLGADELLKILPKDFDDNILDYARQDHVEKIETAGGNWFVRLFHHAKEYFVQVQDPQKQLVYLKPNMSEALTFKKFLESEGTKDRIYLGQSFYLQKKANNDKVYELHQLLTPEVLGWLSITRPWARKTHAFGFIASSEAKQLFPDIFIKSHQQDVDDISQEEIKSWMQMVLRDMGLMRLSKDAD